MTPGAPIGAPYRWDDEAAIRAFVANAGCGLSYGNAPDGVHGVHAPLQARGTAGTVAMTALMRGTAL